MFVRIDQHNWINLKRDEVISVTVELNDETQKFYILIESDGETYETCDFDSETKAIAQAQYIVDQLSAQED